MNAYLIFKTVCYKYQIFVQYFEENVRDLKTCGLFLTFLS